MADNLETVDIPGTVREHEPSFETPRQKNTEEDEPPEKIFHQPLVKRNMPEPS